MKKKILIGIIVLVAIGIFYLEYSALTYGKYRLSPGATTTIKIEKNEGLEGNTELMIKKAGGDVLELLGSPTWTDADNDVYFDTDKQKVTKSEMKNGHWVLVESALKTVNGIQLTQEGIAIDFSEKRSFYISTSKDYTIQIRNLSDHSVYFEAYVIYR